MSNNGIATITVRYDVDAHRVYADFDGTRVGASDCPSDELGKLVENIRQMARIAMLTATGNRYTYPILGVFPDGEHSYRVVVDTAHPKRY
jgi:hypothetical protein